jgi:hypothetical protein
MSQNFLCCTWHKFWKISFQISKWDYGTHIKNSNCPEFVTFTSRVTLVSEKKKTWHSKWKLIFKKFEWIIHIKCIGEWNFQMMKFDDKICEIHHPPVCFLFRYFKSYCARWSFRRIYYLHFQIKFQKKREIYSSIKFQMKMKCDFSPFVVRNVWNRVSISAGCDGDKNRTEKETIIYRVFLICSCTKRTYRGLSSI